MHICGGYGPYSYLIFFIGSDFSRRQPKPFVFARLRARHICSRVVSAGCGETTEVNDSSSIGPYERAARFRNFKLCICPHFSGSCSPYVSRVRSFAVHCARCHTLHLRIGRRGGRQLNVDCMPGRLTRRLRYRNAVLGGRHGSGVATPPIKTASGTTSPPGSSHKALRPVSFSALGSIDQVPQHGSSPIASISVFRGGGSFQTTLTELVPLGAPTLMKCLSASEC